MADDDDFSWDDDPDENVPATDDGDTDTPDPDPEPTPERDHLQQQIRSAEGRYKKSEEKLQEFQSSIQTMQQQLASLSEAKPDPAPEPESVEKPEEVMPDGWSKEEWHDFKDDQPVTAELYENQTRQVQQIREDLDEQRSRQESVSFHEQFRGTVLNAHPDYDELLKNERTDIEKFIDTQANPIVKQAYRNVYEKGTADQVVQLVSDYKEVRPNGGQTEKSENPKVSEALAVTGRSSTPNVGHRGTADPNDFDKAWSDFPDDLDD